VVVVTSLGAVLVTGCESSRERTAARLQQDEAKRDYRAASIDLQNLLRDEPNNISLRVRYADALLHTKDYADAAAEVRKAKKLGASAREVTPLLIEALVGEGGVRGCAGCGGGFGTGRQAAQGPATAGRGSAGTSPGRRGEGRVSVTVNPPTSLIRIVGH
jgi:hypothetical protein